MGSARCHPSEVCREGRRFLIAYWLAFLVPTLASLSPRSVVPSQRGFIWGVIGLFFTLLIGLRFEVGGDWLVYLFHFDTASQGLLYALDYGDPGYYVTGWFFSTLGGSIYWLNLFCAAILMAGVIRFSHAQPKPWLALVVAVPYLIIVVGMGYTRQAAAIGLVMIGLVSLKKGETRWFAVSVLFAALFHTTALLMLPIAALAASKRRIWTAIWITVLFMIIYLTLLEQDVDRLYAAYIDSDYAFASEGAAIRLTMNAVAAGILLLFSRRLVRDPSQRQLYGWMSVIALASLPLLTVSPTAVDRMALYLIPLQLVVFSRLPDLATTGRGKQLLLVSVIGYYALVQFVWLNFASHAFAWLPYQFAPLVDVF